MCNTILLLHSERRNNSACVRTATIQKKETFPCDVESHEQGTNEAERKSFKSFDRTKELQIVRSNERAQSSGPFPRCLNLMIIPHSWPSTPESEGKINYKIPSLQRENKSR
ncbi:hypothetical protein AVEN_271269-1 [Araneus ventricosus]|uniref:Uncharacterized protein n=1 Tax=Araneus ventricosus TaxID=182803 RepID=A0A4Y2G3L3_ARAVE|nr:hypothetical protein AVEN_271269-1 [Araneus ventricosus]